MEKEKFVWNEGDIKIIKEGDGIEEDIFNDEDDDDDDDGEQATRSSIDLKEFISLAPHGLAPANSRGGHQMNEAYIRRIFAKPQSPPPVKLRRSLTRKQRDDVQKKTKGTCHFCGGQLNGSWQADHVIAHHFGGECSVENCLPICLECNRLRWSYPPEMLRLMLRFGTYVKQEIRHRTKLGDQLVRLAIRKSKK